MQIINKLLISGVFMLMLLVLVFVAPNIAQAQYNGNCTYHSSERCVGNSLYWYDSCGNQQDVAQYCQNGCYNNYCQNNNNNNNNYNNYNSYGNCAYHAYKLCSGNNIYWYNSCGTQQDLYSSCVSGQTCQYGQCVAYVAPIQPQNNYIVHATTACYNSSIYWYDSLGVVSGLYRSCTDNNSCTQDSCSGDKCSNVLKCDGSTCATDSADYKTYCSSSQPSQPTNHCGNGLCETTLGETSANCPQDCKINSASAISVSFFTKQDSSSNQWQKAAQIGSNSQVYFMVSIVNNSATQVDNVTFSANIPSEISSLGNLQLNGIQVSGDVVSGVNIGSIAPAANKTITFEGKTGTISENGTKQGTVTTNISGATQSDSISIGFNPSVVPAAVSNAPATSGFWSFLSRWYLWILSAIVLIFLFVVIFKRLSSNV